MSQNSSTLPSLSSSSFSSSSAIYSSVRNYYGRILSQSSDLQTNACCSTPPPSYLTPYLKKVPTPILDKFYGCGNPIPPFIEGLTVLDLGCGSGRDCYVAAAMVGARGKVIGIDMTDEQLAVAKLYVEGYCTRALSYSQPNLSFIKGYIEFLLEAGLSPSSVDVVISNCVVNLSPHKLSVLQSVYNVLKDGGEFYFSDVYSDRRIPQSIRENEVMYGECLAGALYEQDFIRLCRSVGFMDPRVVSRSEITIGNDKLKQIVGNIRFESITYRLFKFAPKAAPTKEGEEEEGSFLDFPSALPTSSLSRLESLCEDYGQYAVYRGTIPHHPHSYALDDHHLFITGKPMLVCGNTALMVGESVTLGKHFTVGGGETKTHYGLFDCSSGSNSSSESSSSGGSCNSKGEKGGCC